MPVAKELPPDAYTPLPSDAVYLPVVPASENVPELTTRSIAWGLLLCVVFTVASAYSGLKVGQVMEAAIPISILAIGWRACTGGAPHCWKTSSSPASAEWREGWWRAPSLRFRRSTFSSSSRTRW
jgi:hypothetical protein